MRSFDLKTPKRHIFRFSHTACVCTCTDTCSLQPGRGQDRVQLSERECARAREADRCTSAPRDSSGSSRHSSAPLDCENHAGSNIRPSAARHLCCCWCWCRRKGGRSTTDRPGLTCPEFVLQKWVHRFHVRWRVSRETPSGSFKIKCQRMQQTSDFLGGNVNVKKRRFSVTLSFRMRGMWDYLFMVF